MGQSLSQIYVHLTFSTKDRQPLIDVAWEEELHACMADIFEKYDSHALIINSVVDHVHVLFRLSKNYSLSILVEEVKKGSSEWVKSIDDDYIDFSWQNGYGAFSVSHFQVDVVTRSIQNQKSQHSHKTYKEEVDEIMKQLGVLEYNSAYFWN